MDTLGEVGGWVYVGSHNLSMSAWGSGTFLGNYELGVLLMLTPSSASTSTSSSSSSSSSSSCVLNPSTQAHKGHQGNTQRGYLPVLQGIQLSSLPLPFISTTVARRLHLSIEYGSMDRPVQEPPVAPTRPGLPRGRGTQGDGDGDGVYERNDEFYMMMMERSWKLLMAIQEQLNYQDVIAASFSYNPNNPHNNPDNNADNPNDRGLETEVKRDYRDEDDAWEPEWWHEYRDHQDCPSGVLRTSGVISGSVEAALVDYTKLQSKKDYHVLCPDGVGKYT